SAVQRNPRRTDRRARRSAHPSAWGVATAHCWELREPVIPARVRGAGRCQIAVRIRRPGIWHGPDSAADGRASTHTPADARARARPDSHSATDPTHSDSHTDVASDTTAEPRPHAAAAPNTVATDSLRPPARLGPPANRVDAPTESHEIQDAARRLSGRSFERNGLRREIRHGVF